MFARCFYSFLHSITNLTTTIPSFDKYNEIAEPSEVVTRPSNNDVNDAQGTTDAFQKKWEHLTIFNLDLSQFTVVLASANESGMCSFLPPVTSFFYLFVEVLQILRNSLLMDR